MLQHQPHVMGPCCSLCSGPVHQHSCATGEPTEAQRSHLTCPGATQPAMLARIPTRPPIPPTTHGRFLKNLTASKRLSPKSMLGDSLHEAETPQQVPRAEHSGGPDADPTLPGRRGPCVGASRQLCLPWAAREASSHPPASCLTPFPQLPRRLLPQQNPYISNPA